jgi:hypothetical protein
MPAGSHDRRDRGEQHNGVADAANLASRPARLLRAQSTAGGDGSDRMTHVGGPGPMIVERRRKASRRCLSCDRRRFVTVATTRLCPVCTVRAEALSFGLEEVSLLSVLTHGRRV